MRRARLTYEGAYHHIMSRGLNGMPIFPDDKAKKEIISIIGEKAPILGIDTYAHCVLDNHYHLVLQNRLMRLSDFMKQVNGIYGIFYRKNYGGKGYVFQGRYKSTLIEDESYLIMAVVYTLLNPVRAGIVELAEDYKWSSKYFNKEGQNFINCEFVEELFGSKEQLNKLLRDNLDMTLPIKKTNMGDIIGGEEFFQYALERFERRKIGGEDLRMRKEMKEFEEAGKVIKEFERKYKIKIYEIIGKNRKERRLRGELLVLLRERCGLLYREIIKYAPFRKLKYSSLGQIYKRIKEK